MKLKQLITGGALAATVLTLGSALAETNYNGIVFCKARIMSSGLDPLNSVSITLPFTTTGSEGGQYTYWNLGVVPPGGVADSWHSEGGPGRFVAHNNGEVGAFVYLTSTAVGRYGMFAQGGILFSEKLDNIACERPRMAAFPSPSLQQWRSTTGRYYCLAFTRDVMTKVPTWHLLNMWNEANDNFEGWRLGDDMQGNVNYIGAYMGHLDAGDYMPFDVKLWAPRWNGGSVDMNLAFTFMVEAAPFPLWEHDVDVQ